MNISRFLIDSKQPADFQMQVINAYPQAVVRPLGDFSGDLLVQIDPDKTILIEVKSSPNDFVASIVDRRLFNQAEGMRKATPWAFLIHPDFKYDSSNRLMGVWDYQGYKAHDHWTRNHIEGTFASIQLHGVVCRPNYRGIVSTISSIINQVDLADRGSITTEPIKLSPFDKDDQEMVNLLAWFDGVGVTQAKNFIEWMKRKDPSASRFAILCKAMLEFKDDDKPTGWTNNTIQRNRKKMGLDIPKEKTEWLEEIDN